MLPDPSFLPGDGQPAAEHGGQTPNRPAPLADLAPGVTLPGRVTDAFFVVDAAWRITRAYAPASAILLVPPDLLVGMTLWEVVPPYVREQAVPGFVLAARQRTSVACDAKIPSIDGWVELRGYPHESGFVVFYTDVSLRERATRHARRVERQLETTVDELLDAERAARAEAEAASRAKSDFLAVISHELRTPLNAITGYAQLLREEVNGPLSEQQHRNAERLEASARHLASLVEGIIDFTHAGTGTLEIAATVVPLGPALAEAHSRVASSIAEKQLRYVAEDARSVVAYADAKRLQQVLVALLENAVKFTPEGGEIRVECAEVLAPGGARATVSIVDTGPGISPDDLPRLFEAFSQADQSYARTTEGVGLGLALARALARAMGGDLTAHSAPGRGSEFTLELPTEPRPTA